MTEAILEKTCVRCGLDVKGRPRAKDAEGRYFCEPCWRTTHRDQPEPTAPPQRPAVNAIDDDELIQLVEELARPIQTSRPNVGSHESKTSVRRTQATTNLPPRRTPPTVRNVDPDAPIPEHLANIAKWERRLLAVFLISIPLFPLILFLIPVHVFVTYKLAKAMDKNGWVWAIGTLLPYAGLIVLLVLNIQATGLLKAAGLHAPLFRAWRWAS